MIDPGLNEKVVLVTGANNPYGIGAAIAKAFASQGSKVFIHFSLPMFQENQQSYGREGRPSRHSRLKAMTVILR
jgi:NAD(P)-dependent dehydrogenase (short-subunit alcohol dehydrogenase family)